MVPVTALKQTLGAGQAAAGGGCFLRAAPGPALADSYPVVLGSTGLTGMANWAGVTGYSPHGSRACCQTHHLTALKASTTLVSSRASQRPVPPAGGWRGAGSTEQAQRSPSDTTPGHGRAVPPAPQGGGRAPPRTPQCTPGHGPGNVTSLPKARHRQQPHLQPLRPCRWPGMQNLLRKLVPHTPCPERGRDLVISNNNIK